MLVVHILEMVKLSELTSGDTPYIHQIAYNNKLKQLTWEKIRDKFKAAGGSPDHILSRNGLSPLHIAAEYGNQIAVQFLLQINPSWVNVQTKTGITPLHIAASKNDSVVTKILLSSGGNKELRNNNNETPLDLAKARNFEDIVNILSNDSVDDEQEEQEIDSPAKFYLKVLNTQELLFEAIDTITGELKSRFVEESGDVDEPEETAEDDFSSNKALVKRLSDSIAEVKEIFLIFTTKVITDHKNQTSFIQEYKAKEKEWTETASVFSKYQERVSEKIDMMEKVLLETKQTKDECLKKLHQKEQELVTAYETIVSYKDLLIRMRSIQERRANLEKIRRHIEDEESNLLADIADLQI